MGRAALLLIAVLPLGACGAGSSNGESKKPAQQVVADAEAAARNASLVHVRGASTDNGLPLKLDIWMGAKKGKGHLQQNGVGFDVVRVGDTIYVKGSDAFWRQIGSSDAAVAQLHGKWLKGSSSSVQLRSLTSVTDLDAFFTGVLRQHGKIVNRGETTKDGEKVVEIRDTTEGGALYVAAHGDPYPLSLEGNGTMVFSDWNADEPIAAPKNAVDLATLEK